MTSKIRISKIPAFKRLKKAPILKSDKVRTTVSEHQSYQHVIKLSSNVSDEKLTPCSPNWKWLGFNASNSNE